MSGVLLQRNLGVGKWTDRQEETRLVTVEPLELGSMYRKVRYIPFVNAKALKRSKWEKRGLRKIIASGTQPLPATAPASSSLGVYLSVTWLLHSSQHSHSSQERGWGGQKGRTRLRSHTKHFFHPRDQT